MFFITCQKGTEMFAIPTLGTLHLLHYSWVTCRKGQYFLNSLLCGWSGCPGVGNYPRSFHLEDNCRGLLTTIICF